MEQCQWQSLTALGAQKTYKTFALVTYVLGWLVFLSLLVGTGLRVLQGFQLSLLHRVQVGSCVGFGVFSILAVITFPGFEEASIGWPVFVAFVGSLGGIVAASQLSESGGGWGNGGVYIPVTAAPTAPAAGTTIGVPTAARALPAAPLSKTPDNLRFVATQVEFDLNGFRAELSSGEEKVIRWMQIDSLIARRLPNGPPFEGITIFDLVLRSGGDGSVTPIRLLPSTSVNYQLLPDGAGTTPRQNFRKLAAFIRSRNPGVTIEGDSQPFFETSKEAKQFIAMKLFAEYDQQFRES